MKKSVYAFTLLSALVFNCHDEIVIQKHTKLDYYIESFDIDGLGFEPQLKITYDYNESGRLLKYRVFGYNPDLKDMEEQRYFTFSYSNDKVDQIKGYWPDETDPYVTYNYEYLTNNAVSKIIEDNQSTALHSEANFTYHDDGTIKVSYTYSNGQGFDYEFNFADKNILSDKTTRGAELCSYGQYTYDTHRNPFQELNYVDYDLTNLSANNRLTEDVNYINCVFPTLEPESYTYEYNDEGYPTLGTVGYRSDGIVKSSKKEFFYTEK